MAERVTTDANGVEAIESPALVKEKLTQLQQIWKKAFIAVEMLVELTGDPYFIEHHVGEHVGNLMEEVGEWYNATRLSIAREVKSLRGMELSIRFKTGGSAGDVVINNFEFQDFDFDNPNKPLVGRAPSRDSMNFRAESIEVRTVEPANK